MDTDAGGCRQLTRPHGKGRWKFPVQLFIPSSSVENPPPFIIRVREPFLTPIRQDSGLSAGASVTVYQGYYWNGGLSHTFPVRSANRGVLSAVTCLTANPQGRFTSPSGIIPSSSHKSFILSTSVSQTCSHQGPLNP